MRIIKRGGIDSTVALYLPMIGADATTTFYDFSSYHHTVTAGGTAQIDTAQAKFGAGSALIAYNAAYMTVADNAAFDFGTGDFTIGGWFRSTGWSTNRLWGVGDYAVVGLCCYYTGTNMTLYTGGAAIFNTAWTATANVWHYIVVSRAGTSLRVDIDGTQLGSTVTSSTNFSTADGVYIAAWSGVLTETFGGWIDDLVIRKGAADYTMPTKSLA